MRTTNRKPGKFSQIIPDFVMTKEKFTELKNKLHKLKNFSQPKAASEVSRLAELGDFSENTEYQMAKGKLRGINNSILNLEKQLNRAEIISFNSTKNTVEIGNKVTIENESKKTTYQILGSLETNPQKGIISYRSPVGAALLGKKIGEVIEIITTNKVSRYKIIKID